MLALNLVVLNQFISDILDVIAKQLEILQPHTSYWRSVQEGAARSFSNIYGSGSWSNEWIKSWESQNFDSPHVTHVVETIQVEKITDLPNYVIVL